MEEEGSVLLLWALGGLIKDGRRETMTQLWSQMLKQQENAGNRSYRDPLNIDESIRETL